jgi:hypothetical protein
MTGIATPQELLDRLSAAAKRNLSGAEIHQQRVSFVMSAVDDESTITKDQVEQVLKQHEGK